MSEMKISVNVYWGMNVNQLSNNRAQNMMILKDGDSHVT